ncbi:MAG: fructose-1,6-bisphosphate aldolase, class II [Candidatus Infernicultor aquiphilus]|uniref:Fructose-1,6-bisphosphate aldolase, class II n=1 Tax=Candidatus Infernicultor aquiphilus TaxID=1805029 RepID=A0A1J5GRF9_9BACT|nr:class II fructose-1,6-bisphosphate aldolase [bacterium]OIP71215.1 MAG: fructose-1,6-bisphosphate aldolase, class II [Candidatus Atribacteria bacterium CG2_30_33_13]PIX33593.1 MAG: fructose-1,6-bisphosphate aldolase, class II [Candidatus Atribacteria bacterium CG_4_8_14_3_um_filter_34_18]PIY33237.1 MAG: fructose-1,6-bisphosphate aldolase, class II [Candidatus Atribacteria bacterium CG_4_10_14_3_um_filter_34_13]PJB57838.1 MAG: fructose-1,6-bisphosphate aldolase, class II [Candidatus Atribacter
MSLVTTKEMLKKAQKERYGVGAFNANNMEIIQAIIETAEEEKAPAILQASQGAIEYAGLDNIVAMVKVMAEKVSVPIALHLDHGTDYYQNIKCLRAGFTSLMFDGSKLPFEENVKITKKVVEMAHACDIPVEAELGQIGKMGDSDEPGVALEKVKETMADPYEAAKFVELTKIDFLAAAVGTIHGCRTPFAKLDIPRIEKIRELTDVPLVLHGASGVNDEEVRKGISAGICKINIDTRIRMIFTKKIREIIKMNPQEIDPRKLLGPAREVAKEIIRERMRVFGCSGKA